MDFEALERLARLRDTGVLTDDEFQLQKERLLSQQTHQQAGAAPIPSSTWTGGNILRLAAALTIIGGIIVFVLLGGLNPEARDSPAASTIRQSAVEPGAIPAREIVSPPALPKEGSDPQERCYGRWLNDSKGNGGEDAFLLTISEDGGFKVDSFTGGDERGDWAPNNSRYDPGTLALYEEERADGSKSIGSTITDCGARKATFEVGEGSVSRDAGTYTLIRVASDFDTETAKRGIFWNPD